MERLIVENRSRLSMYDALLLVVDVVEQGRISGSEDDPEYCYVTRVSMGGEKFLVYSRKNKRSDRLVVTGG